MKKIKVVIAALTISGLLCSCATKAADTEKSAKKAVSAINSPNNGSYLELEKLPRAYTVEVAKKNGDVVYVHKQVYNLEKLDNFISSVKDKTVKLGDMVRIVSYTIEGDALIYDVKSTGNALMLIVDNTRDKFSSKDSKKRSQYKVQDIYKQAEEDGTYYKVKIDQKQEFTLLFAIDR